MNCILSPTTPTLLVSLPSTNILLNYFSNFSSSTNTVVTPSPIFNDINAIVNVSAPLAQVIQYL